MAFDSLGDKLAKVFKNLRSKGKLNEADVKQAMRDVRLALLEADVNYKVAKDFTNSVAEKCIGENVMESLTAPQMVVKIVRDQLTELMGSEQKRLNTSSKIPTVIMMCGLQGAGKTTHCAKLAAYLKSQGHRPLLVGCDIYRPAAIEQLKVVGAQVNVPVFEKGTQKPEKTAEEAVRHARDYGNDFVILDTAGRLQNKTNLMNELSKIRKVIDREAEGCLREVLLVLDATTGQNAISQAKTFGEATGVTGVILTKLDGTAKGGVVIGIKHEFDLPVKLIGVGEQIDQMEFFDSKAFSTALFNDEASLTNVVEEIVEDIVEEVKEQVAELKEDFAEFKDEMAEEFAELNREFGEVEADFKEEVQELKEDFNEVVEDVKETVAEVEETVKKEKKKWWKR